MRPSLPLGARRRDYVVSALIALVCLLLVAGAWWLAPARDAHLEPADPTQRQDTPPPPREVPQTLTEVFQAPAQYPAATPRPIVSAGTVLAYEGSTAQGLDAHGQPLWSYHRDHPACALAEAWDSVVLAFDEGFGCGDVVAVDARKGTYAATRSALATDSPAVLSSNDRVGLAGSDRVELWRSDLVRTVEYGKVEAPQEPGAQPHPECTITSTLTRTELLAITETCPGSPGATLRFLEATPEDSRKPEVISEVPLDDPAARLVAIGQHAAAIYSDSTIRSYAEDGAELTQRSVPAAGNGLGLVPPTADLPHHMSWFDGERLYLFDPDDLSVSAIIDDALGLGISVAGRTLVPVEGGIGVLAESGSTIERVIPVDRARVDAPVHLNIAGSTIVEKRDDTLVGLRAD
ncbi:hypothetical protein [Corynebacterium tapiri]|uniref:Uncharacterized protein n=1 Tax=Corynebacterium tapiri TaxID=1448266 RepID=A0A5C4U3W4_9CORY|nr:hypothetical protein [Corynebacterium tapiri]TNL98403.1 hypothetical protein FHE74_04180 [Corynebacterium tapiri]